MAEQSFRVREMHRYLVVLQETNMEHGVCRLALFVECRSMNLRRHRRCSPSHLLRSTIPHLRVDPSAPCCEAVRFVGVTITTNGRLTTVISPYIDQVIVGHKRVVKN